MNTFASQYADTLSKTCNLSVLICDRDAVIAVGGVSKKEYMDKAVSKSLDTVMQKRGLYKQSEESMGEKIYATEDEGEQSVSCAMPIISEGDVIGCVVSLQNDQSAKRDASSIELESKLIITAANFLGKQMES